MRISGGSAKGIPLEVPKGKRLRPASEAARERLFSSLANLVSGATFLDLFAGTGAYGLEAVSRGASEGTFVEQDAKTVEVLRRNLASVCRSANLSLDKFKVITGNALQVGPKEGPIDLVFVDPPYPILLKVAPKLFSGLLEDGVAGKGTLLVLELPSEAQFDPKGWCLEKRLGKARRGSPTHALFRAS
ncbi:MAG: RsmD family RNA methyltransferase [Opitutales bacterium]